MNLSPGSVVSLTPVEPGITIEFSGREDPWAVMICPVIGWAVVVTSLRDEVATTTLVPAYLNNGVVKILSTVPDPELACRILPPSDATTACSSRHLKPWCGYCGTPETDPNPDGPSGRWRFRNGEPCPDCHPSHIHAPTGE